MSLNYKTVYKSGEGEIIEKKSRFLISVLPVTTEEEAASFIESMRKKHWNASHNCYAYIIGKQGEIKRCSDDGEPSGTAGKPMLDVLAGAELNNVLVIVTRYFGGTLLGTGGLVRAYSMAAKEGLTSSVIITKMSGVKLQVMTDYTGLGKIQYILGQRKLKTTGSVYTENVELEVISPAQTTAELMAEISAATNGKAKVSKGKECYFAEIDGEIKILED